MKRLLIISNVVLLGIIIISNRGSGQQTSVAKTDSCANKLCQGYLRNDIQEFTSNIDYETAVQLSRSYNADAGKKYICNGSTISRTEDATSLVFDLSLLKKYIWYVESTMCRNGCGGDVQLGLRFYYGKYPAARAMRANASLKGVDSTYANRHTLFMVPVLRHLFTKEKYRDFNPGAVKANCNLGNAFNFAIPLNKAWILCLTTDPAPDGSQENHGSLRPPPADSGVFPSN